MPELYGDNSILNTIIIFVLCYLTGSIPTAYILVKSRTNRDITKEGSGNVGTLNSFTVTKSKTIGVTVLVLDLLKGLLPVYLLLYVFNQCFPVVMFGSLGLVTGHNYPVWLKFKGGRGLAPGAGIFIAVNYFVIIGWVLVWLLVFLTRKKVLIANTAATFAIPVYVLVINIFSNLVINSGSNGFSLMYFNIFSILITAVIISRHTEVLNKKVSEI